MALLDLSVLLLHCQVAKFNGLARLQRSKLFGSLLPRINVKAQRTTEQVDVQSGDAQILLCGPKFVNVPDDSVQFSKKTQIWNILQNGNELRHDVVRTPLCQQIGRARHSHVELVDDEKLREAHKLLWLTVAHQRLKASRNVGAELNGHSLQPIWLKFKSIN